MGSPGKHRRAFTSFACEKTQTPVLSVAVLAELGTSYVDQILLSVRIGPLQNVESDSVDEDFLPMILPLYRALEELHEKETIHGLGVSDLDKEKLQPLYEAAKVRVSAGRQARQLSSNANVSVRLSGGGMRWRSCHVRLDWLSENNDCLKIWIWICFFGVKVKPLIAQVNLVSCCVMPPLLVSYAKEHDVQLLTHNDPAGACSCSRPCLRCDAVVTTSSLAPGAACRLQIQLWQRIVWCQTCHVRRPPNTV